MTNGEKLIEVFPSIGLYKKAHDGIQINFNSVWFNAEYKEPTTKNDLGVEEVTALAEWIEKLTKECEEAYNKGYADGVKSVNICPHCGEYIGEEE